MGLFNHPAGNDLGGAIDRAFRCAIFSGRRIRFNSHSVLSLLRAPSPMPRAHWCQPPSSRLTAWRHIAAPPLPLGAPASPHWIAPEP